MRDQTEIGERVLFEPPTIKPPPGPMGTLEALAALNRNMLEVLDEGLFHSRFRSFRWLGRTYHQIMDPELMQAVLLDHADDFPKSALQQRVLRPAVGDSVLTVEGAEWRRQRRAAAPAFRNDALLRMVPAIADVAEETAARLGEASRAGAVDIAPEMVRATL
ncbi:MAG TPA: cytochrome P450, partial [Caulobacteraceae bacterium]